MVVTAGRKDEDHGMQLAELKELARSAGVEVVDVVTQQRPRPDPRFLIGAGKLQDLVIQAFQSNVDLVIFDQNLTPTQARNLAERLDLIVESKARPRGWPAALAASYLKGNLVFELTDRRRQGLELFYDKACEHGVIERRRSLEIASRQ